MGGRHSRQAEELTPEQEDKKRISRMVMGEIIASTDPHSAEYHDPRYYDYSTRTHDATLYNSGGNVAPVSDNSLLRFWRLSHGGSYAEELYSDAQKKKIAAPSEPEDLSAALKECAHDKKIQEVVQDTLKKRQLLEVLKKITGEEARNDFKTLTIPEQLSEVRKFRRDKNLELPHTAYVIDYLTGRTPPPETIKPHTGPKNLYLPWHPATKAQLYVDAPRHAAPTMRYEAKRNAILHMLQAPFHEQKQAIYADQALVLHAMAARYIEGGQ